MITSRYPAGIESIHACIPDQDILNGFIQGMAHMKYAGYIRRWYDHGIGLTMIGLAGKIIPVKPMPIPFFFY
jgi:hypothetical protein